MGESAAATIEALASGAVRVAVARDLVVATGADRARFLHGIVTADVTGTPVGGGCHAALLTLKAHIVADIRIFAREAELYLITAAGQGAPMTEALGRYAIMDDFTAEPRPDFALLAVLGPAAALRLNAVGYATDGLAPLPLWSHADAQGPLGTVWMARVRQLGSPGYWIGAPSADLARFSAALEDSGVPLLPPALAEAARVAAGEPAWGQEITSDYFPMEVGLGDAIDYAKGCFLGQEPIVRIRDRGHVNWHLVRLDLEG
ncbi:MAG: hypothetical protein ABUR63_06995, partial [Verrucomicrobiota bacterium]